MLQPCFASIAKLKFSKSLNPSPPIAFAFPIWSHLIQCILLSWPICPHQYPLISLLISCSRPLGSLNTPMLYVGMARITDLMRISFPACERNFIFQLVNLLLTLSRISLKTLSLNLPTKAGNPRYFSYEPVDLIPAMLAIRSLVAVLVLLLKNMDVLSLFNLCPEACS